jgi:hypothetical protein
MVLRTEQTQEAGGLRGYYREGDPGFFPRRRGKDACDGIRRGMGRMGITVTLQGLGDAAGGILPQRIIFGKQHIYLQGGKPR